MGDGTHHRFTDRADNYAAHRPSYPDACVDDLLVGMGHPAMLAVADVGAGTGIMARLIAVIAKIPEIVLLRVFMVCIPII